MFLSSPATISILDVSPYNTLVINCSVAQPDSVIVSKMIEWRKTSGVTTQTLTADGSTINITTGNLNQSSTTSSLSVTAHSTGDTMYTCLATLQVPGDPLVSYSETAAVTIKGTFIQGFWCESIPVYKSRQTLHWKCTPYTT